MVSSEETSVVPAKTDTALGTTFVFPCFLGAGGGYLGAGGEGGGGILISLVSFVLLSEDGFRGGDLGGGGGGDNGGLCTVCSIVSDFFSSFPLDQERSS